MRTSPQRLADSHDSVAAGQEAAYRRWGQWIAAFAYAPRGAISSPPSSLFQYAGKDDNSLQWRKKILEKMPVEVHRLPHLKFEIWATQPDPFNNHSSC
jgi:hypothetical protein